MYPGMYRHAFTDEDRRKMIDFLYRRIQECPQFASRTCGTLLWADFIKYMRWNRTPMGVSSHFRKVVKPKLYSFNNEPEKVLYCMKAMQCDVLIHEQNTIARLYSKYDITYKLKYGKYVIESYTLKDTSDNHATENDEEVSDVDVTNIDESSDEQGGNDSEIERGRREAEKRRCPQGWYSKQRSNRRMAWMDESDESDSSDGQERRPNDEGRNLRRKSPAKNSRPTVAATSVARETDDSHVRNILQSPPVTSPPTKRARNGRRRNDEETSDNIRETPPPEVSRSRPSNAESTVHEYGVDALLDQDATMIAAGVVEEEAADDCMILEPTQSAGVDSLLAMSETFRDSNTAGGTGVAGTSYIANRDAAIPVIRDSNTEGGTSVVAAAAAIANCGDSVIQIRDSNTEGATAVAATATTTNCDVAVQVDAQLKNVRDAACNTDFLMMTISAEDDSWRAFFTVEQREERVKRLKIPHKVDECFFTLAGSEMEYLYNLELAAPLAAFNNETGYKKQFKRKMWKKLCEVSDEDEAEIFKDSTRYMEYALRMINCAATHAARAAGTFNLPLKYWADRLAAVLVDDAAAPGRLQRRIAKAKKMGGATAEVSGVAGEGGGAAGERGGATGEVGGASGVFCILQGFTISADRAHRLDNLIVETVREAKDMPAEQMNARLSVFYYELKIMIRLHQEIEAIKKDGPTAFLSAPQYPGRLPWLPYPDGRELFEVEEGDEEGGGEEGGVENANAANGATRETEPSPEL